MKGTNILNDKAKVTKQKMRDLGKGPARRGARSEAPPTHRHRHKHSTTNGTGAAEGRLSRDDQCRAGKGFHY